MPLVKSKSKEAFSSNVRAEMDAGKPQKQALAIAYSVARRAASGGGISAEEFEERAKKIMAAPRSKLDRVYPGERYDDTPTYAAQKRVTDEFEKSVPMPAHPRKPDQPYAIKMAGGGNPYAPRPKASDISGYMSRKMIHKAVGAGMLKSPVPGRTDKLPISVPSGSYVIPADIVSGLGQGNSDAGNQILSKMFNAGPMGMSPLKGKKATAFAGAGMASRLGAGRVPKGGKTSFADGGEVEQVPVIAAGGEYILHPEQVAALGNGDLTKGHEVLDAFVLHSRKELVKTLKKLPGPVKD